MTAELFLDGRMMLWCADMRAAVPQLAENSVDSSITDPPYHLTSIVKRFGAENAAPAKVGKTGAYARASAGFMGKVWDGGDIAFQVETWREVFRVLKPGAHLLAFGGTRTYHRMVCALEDAGFEVRDQIGWAFGQGFPKSHNMGNGWGTALKPAWEPIVLARKPLSEGTVAANFLKWGTGALNIDGCRVAAEDLPEFANRNGASVNAYGDGLHGSARTGRMLPGRWPANVIHDGSDEVVGVFPDAKAGGNIESSAPSDKTGTIFGKFTGRFDNTSYQDGGSAARFFYSAKADSDDRLGSKHPTVKPLDLMQYLVRLVTSPGGTVLDPFAGTGTTGEAAYREGCSAILIEREPEYQADIRRRMGLVLGGPAERCYATIKAAGKTDHAGPLFAESP